MLRKEKALKNKEKLADVKTMMGESYYRSMTARSAKNGGIMPLLGHKTRPC